MVIKIPNQRKKTKVFSLLISLFHFKELDLGLMKFAYVQIGPCQIHFHIQRKRKKQLKSISKTVFHCFTSFL